MSLLPTTLLGLIALTLAVVVGVIVACVLFYLLYLLFAYVIPTYLIHRKLAAQGVPCHPFIPYIGHVPTLARYRAQHRAIYFLEDAVRLHGKVHASNMPTTTILRLNDPRYIASVLRASNNASYPKAEFVKLTLETVLGTRNLLLSDPADHSHRRRTLNPAFHHQLLAGMTDLMVRETLETIDGWLQQLPTATVPPPSITIELSRAMSDTTFAIIAACAFGSGFKAIPHSSEIISDALRRSLDILMHRISLLIEGLPLLRELPILGRPEQVQARGADGGSRRRSHPTAPGGGDRQRRRGQEGHPRSHPRGPRR